MYIDLIRDIPIDYMHMILEGISKMLLSYWGDGSLRDHRFYIGREINQLDNTKLSLELCLAKEKGIVQYVK